MITMIMIEIKIKKKRRRKRRAVIQDLDQDLTEKKKRVKKDTADLVAEVNLDLMKK